jgi:DNA ligase-1
MIKIVQWHRAEAIVVSVEELMRNENEAETNELGYQTRSHAIAGQVPGDTLGAICCEMLVSSDSAVNKPVLFSIGTGFDAEQRDKLWRNPPIGKIITFKYKELSKYGVPRHPVFVGFRSNEDMS